MPDYIDAIVWFTAGYIWGGLGIAFYFFEYRRHRLDPIYFCKRWYVITEVSPPATEAKSDAQ